MLLFTLSGLSVHLSSPKYVNENPIRYSADLKNLFVVEADGTLTPIRLLNKTENAFVKREKIHLCRGEEYFYRNLVHELGAEPTYKKPDNFRIIQEEITRLSTEKGKLLSSS